MGPPEYVYLLKQLYNDRVVANICAWTNEGDAKLRLKEITEELVRFRLAVDEAERVGGKTPRCELEGVYALNCDYIEYDIEEIELL